MTDDEFLEKVGDVADKWSKPYLVAVGGYLLSTLVIALNVTDWVVANVRDNLGALVAFGIGGILTGAVIASIFWRYSEVKEVVMELKDRIIKSMDARGMSQADLCKETGMGSSKISQLLKGKTTDPRLSTVVAIANALGVSLDYLAGRKDTPKIEYRPLDVNPDERELLWNYRASEPQWRKNIAMTARAAAGESKEIAGDSVPEVRKEGAA